MPNQPPATRYIEKTDPWSSHALIRKWLREFAPHTKVLDIGTASGMLGRACAGAGFDLSGIEPVSEWAEIARPYYREVLCATLEQAPDAFIAGQDVVICSDVLEHTPNPQLLLKRLVRLQKPTTQFLISVPNVAHLWIRINLLFGKFNYTENGILDRSHLRFFTHASFLELLQGAGLGLLEMNYTPVPLTRVNPFFENNGFGRLLHRGLAGLSRRLPNLLAYQFVARLRILPQEDTI